MSGSDVVNMVGVLVTLVGVPAGWLAIYCIAVRTNRRNDHQRALNRITQEHERAMAEEALRVARLHNDRTVALLAAESRQGQPWNVLDLDARRPPEGAG